MYKNSKLVREPKRIQDITHPGVLVFSENRKGVLNLYKYISVIMLLQVVLLPAFPVFAQEPEVVERNFVQGTVVADNDVDVGVSSTSLLESNNVGQIVSLGEEGVVESVAPASSTSDNASTTASTTDVVIKTDTSSTTPDSLTFSEADVTHNDVVVKNDELQPGVSLDVLREQIRREVEEELRKKVADKTFEDEVRNEVVERIRQGCLEFEDGSYYCIKNEVQQMPTSTQGVGGVPSVFISEARSGAGREVFLRDGSAITQVSRGARDVLFPAVDLYSSSVVWQALVDDKWHIMVYDRTMASTTQLTTGVSNNMNPQIQKGVIVWQGWINNNWEIFVAEKKGKNNAWETKKITENAWHDMFPRISDDFITWQAYEGGVWRVFMYDRETGSVSRLSQGDEKSENPRFVVLWEKRGLDGAVQTFGYDMTSGESLVIGKHEDKSPFSQDLPQSPLQENKVVIPSSQITKVKSSLDEGGGE